MSALSERDRLALIMFDQEAFCLQSLTVLSEANKRKTLSKILSIKPFGQTNIGSAIDVALHMVNNRKIRNDITAILLLTDG